MVSDHAPSAQHSAMQVEGTTPATGGWGVCQHRDEQSRRLVYAILLAQFLSIALAVTGVSSSALTSQGIHCPTVQACLAYCLLAAAFGSAQLLGPCLQQHIYRWQGKQYHSLAPAADCLAIVSSNDVDSIRNSCGSCQHHHQEEQQEVCNTAKGGCTSSSSNWERLRRMWPAFAALALIDVEANVLVTKAYQFTSLTSVTLLDCFTIPSVMLLSWLLLKNKYRAGHFAGAALCISGLAVLVLGDAGSSGAEANASSSNGASGLISTAGSIGQRLLSAAVGHDSGMHMESTSGSSSSGFFGAMAAVIGSYTGHIANDSSSSSSSNPAGPAPLLGDALVLLGALLYAVCNVTQELLLGNIEPAELLAGVGLFGALISGTQAAVLGEWQALLAQGGLANWSVISPMLGFGAAMFCFYSLVPRVLIFGGSTTLNLSLLTSDLWAALARFLWFGGFEGSSVYFFMGSLALVAVGIVVYALSGSHKDSSSSDQNATAVAYGNAAAGGAAVAAAAAAVQGLAGIPGRGHVMSEGGSYGRLMSSDGDVEDQLPAAATQQQQQQSGTD